MLQRNHYLKNKKIKELKKSYKMNNNKDDNYPYQINLVNCDWICTTCNITLMH